MTVSATTPWWQGLRYWLFPRRYKRCPAGNLHPSLDQVCYCRLNECGPEWHGGVWDFHLKRELIPYTESKVKKRQTMWG